MRFYFIVLSALCVAAAGGCGDDNGGNGSSGLCSTFCERDAECFPDQQQPDCANWCADRLSTAENIGAQCSSAVTDTFECLNDLSSCEELLSWWNEDPADSYSCKAEDDQVDASCFGDE